MKYAEWRDERRALAQRERELYLLFRKTYLVPPEPGTEEQVNFLPDAGVWIWVWPEMDKDTRFRVRVTAHGRFEGDIDAGRLSPYELEVVARISREIWRWYRSERDGLPTAKELEVFEYSTIPPRQAV